MSHSAAGKSRRGGPGRAERSQSEVVGVVLVFGIVIVGAFAILALGATAVDDTEGQLAEDRAEKTLTQFDSKAGLVALGEANSQEVSLPAGADETFSVNESAGTLSIDITERDSEDRVEWLEGEPLIEATLGALEYENDDTKLAYQGGGVFRAGQTNGTMISPPEFHYRDGTLTLPIVNVTGDRSVGSTASVTQSDEKRVFPLAGDEDKINPLEDAEVEVTVESEYYEGWGQYFEARTDGSVDYDHDSQSVTITLVTPIGEITYEDAVLTTAGDFYIRGAGNPDIPTIDGHDSSEGEEYEKWKIPASMSIAGNVDISGGNVQIHGDIRAESVECNANAVDIHGSVYYGSYFDPGHPQPCSYDDDEEITSVPSASSIEPYVSEQIESLKDEADSPGTELTAGRYYDDTVDGIDSVDTTDGDVVLGAEELTIDNPIEVEGENDFRIFVNDSAYIDAKLTTEGDVQDGTVTTLLGKDDLEVEVDAEYWGAIYAPGVNSEIIVDDTIFGATVAGIVDVQSGGGGDNRVIFDKALENEQPVPEDASVIKITYLHITENEIEID